MLKLLKIIRDAGEATIKYPFAPAEFTPTFRGKPEYDPKRCIACAACAIACPPNALTIETDLEKGVRTWRFSAGRCIFCGRCEEVCPTRALHLSQEFELAVMRKDDLYERCTFSLCHCNQCGTAFAPQKEVDYALALTMQADGVTEEDPGQRRQFETCPQCKRKQTLGAKPRQEV